MATARSALFVLALALPACLAASTAGKAADTPISKVLQLMQDMLAKGIKEKKEEAVRYSAFNQWCQDQTRIKTDEIEVGNAKIEQLKATIEKYAVEIRELTRRILELDEDVGRWNKDIKSSTDVRKMERADYEATLTDFSETLDALDEAIALLKKHAAGTAQPESNPWVQALLQVRKSKFLPIPAKSALTAFLQEAQPSVEEMPSQDLFWKAPEAYSYEFQSGGVVDMLVKLKYEFSDKKTDLMKEELTADHAYEQILQQLADSIENAQYEIEKKKVLRAQTEKAKAEAEADLVETTAERDADQKYLDGTAALFKQKTDDFQSRQELRAGEIETLQKAIEIISSDAVGGTGDRHLPALLQAKSKGGHGTSLSQLRSGQVSPLQSRIADFLAERARLSGSRLLSEVSQRVAGDPFTKVKKLIKDLIIQLSEEATSETEHKGWCDVEVTTNKQVRDKKTAEINALTTEIEDLTAEIAKLTQDLADLANAIAELETAMAQATEERTTSKATNEQTIKEAKEAQVAVQQATEVVKAYYAKSAQATALLQQTPEEDAPETFVKPYQGMLPEGGNVVDFLEVIMTDFVRLESETSSSEEAEQAAYDQFMFISRKDKALKENESGHKTGYKADKEGALHSAQEELKMTQEQLDRAIDYYDKLKPTCIHSGISYESRVKMRESEIQSLQEALSILTGQDLERPRTATAGSF